MSFRSWNLLHLHSCSAAQGNKIQRYYLSQGYTLCCTNFGWFVWQAKVTFSFHTTLDQVTFNHKHKVIHTIQKTLYILMFYHRPLTMLPVNFIQRGRWPTNINSIFCWCVSVGGQKQNIIKCIVNFLLCSKIWILVMVLICIYGRLSQYPYLVKFWSRWLFFFLN